MLQCGKLEAGRKSCRFVASEKCLSFGQNLLLGQDPWTEWQDCVISLTERTLLVWRKIGGSPPKLYKTRPGTSFGEIWPKICRKKEIKTKLQAAEKKTLLYNCPFPRYFCSDQSDANANKISTSEQSGGWPPKSPPNWAESSLSWKTAIKYCFSWFIVAKRTWFVWPGYCETDWEILAFKLAN